MDNYVNINKQYIGILTYRKKALCVVHYSIRIKRLNVRGVCVVGNKTLHHKNNDYNEKIHLTEATLSSKATHKQNFILTIYFRNKTI